MKIPADLENACFASLLTCTESGSLALMMRVIDAWGNSKSVSVGSGAAGREEAGEGGEGKREWEKGWGEEEGVGRRQRWVRERELWGARGRAGR